MTTKNHPANGPVSLDRLRQIRKILIHAAAQSDGGNLGYAMADAVKVIDGAIAALGAEPQRNPVLAYADSYRDMAKRGVESIPVWSVITDLERNIAPLYTAPPAPVEPDDGREQFEVWMLKKWGRERQEYDFAMGKFLHGENYADSYTRNMWNAWSASRAAMLQAGNSPVTPGCWCSTCRPVTMNDMRFVVCHECGNKRCPHANDHRHACTGSNDPGQVGSAYPAAPQQEVK